MRQPHTGITRTRPLSQGRTERVTQKYWQSYATLHSYIVGTRSGFGQGVNRHA